MEQYNFSQPNKFRRLADLMTAFKDGDDAYLLLNYASSVGVVNFESEGRFGLERSFGNAEFTDVQSGVAIPDALYRTMRVRHEIIRNVVWDGIQEVRQKVDDALVPFLGLYCVGGDMVRLVRNSRLFNKDYGLTDTQLFFIKTQENGSDLMDNFVIEGAERTPQIELEAEFVEVARRLGAGALRPGVRGESPLGDFNPMQLKRHIDVERIATAGELAEAVAPILSEMGDGKLWLGGALRLFQRAR